MCGTLAVSGADTGSLESAFICRAQKQHCAGVITQRKSLGRRNESKSLDCEGCGASGTCAIVPPKEFHLFCVLLVRQFNLNNVQYSLTRVPLVGRRCYCARRPLCEGFFFNGLSSSNQWMRAAVFLKIPFLNLWLFSEWSVTSCFSS